MAHCRSGGLGYNRAECEGCKQGEWYPSSCGDRHCPNCLGPRQAQWSQQVCERLPDCPHFHVVFTVPEELGEFFEANYKVAAAELFGAAAETLKTFQSNNWGMRGGFFGVLHTWGSALNWHPHLHMLVSAGGADLESGRWREVRGNYLFPVKSMSKVFGAIMLRRLEALDGDGEIKWPTGLETVEERRDWRLRLARKSWNIYCRPTLGNTRAVVRYLARYTSRIAMSNHRITRVDESARTVSFGWKDYSNGGGKKEMTVDGKVFLWRFARHMVPKGLRRVRYFGLLSGARNRFKQLPGCPAGNIAEEAPEDGRPACRHCGCQDWDYTRFYRTGLHPATAPSARASSISLEGARAGPTTDQAVDVQQVDEDRPPLPPPSGVDAAA